MSATYVLYKFQMKTSAGRDLAEKEVFEQLYEVAGLGAPYRVADPEKEDFRNYVIDPDEIEIQNKRCAVFSVGYVIDHRQKFEYDPVANKILATVEKANDVRHSRGILIPKIGVAAFKDGSGDRLPADSAIARLQAILEFHTDVELHYEKTASKADVLSALKRLNLREFSFNARPFNPHPKSPGNRLHELMKKANAGTFRGVAKANSQKGLQNAEDGLVNEVVGLSNGDYADFGIKGKTKSGTTVSYRKQPLSGDKAKDHKKFDQPRNFRVSVPTDDPETSEEVYAAATMIELYDGD